MILTCVVGIIATFVFEVFPENVIKMFGTEDELYMQFAIKTFRIFLALVTFTCSIKVISIFFQAVGEPVKATIVSLARDIILFVPLVIILPKYMGVEGPLFAAPAADFFAMIISIILVILFFKNIGKEQIIKDENAVLQKTKKGVIITISREHGSQGKYIGNLIANKLGIPYYYKEMTALAAQKSGLDKEFVSKINQSGNIMHDLYLSSSPVQYAIDAQDKAIRMIADQGSCVLVGRAADYVLKDYENVIKIFIHAPKEYRVKNIMEMYNDSEKDAVKNIEKSDKNRASYYSIISGQTWGNVKNYDLCIDSSIGKEQTAEIICEYIRKKAQIC